MPKNFNIFPRFQADQNNHALRSPDQQQLRGEVIFEAVKRNSIFQENRQSLRLFCNVKRIELKITVWNPTLDRLSCSPTKPLVSALLTHRYCHLKWQILYYENASFVDAAADALTANT